jgi:hypothetical protein
MPDTTTTIPQLNLLNLPQLQAIQQQIETLIKQGGAGPLTLPTNVNLAQLANINKQLEAFVQLASTILPILSTFVPQLKILIPILPVLTGLLKMGDDIAQAGNDPAKIADALAAHLKDVAQQVQALKLPGQSLSVKYGIPEGLILHALKEPKFDLAPDEVRHASLLERGGGGLSIKEVAERLGRSDREVLEMWSNGGLLAVPWRGGVLFPKVQFDKSTAQPLAGIDNLLAAVGGRNPWSVLESLVVEDSALGGSSILDALREGKVDVVGRFIRQITADGFA